MGIEWRRGRHRLGLPGHYHAMLIPAVADGVARRRRHWFSGLTRPRLRPRWRFPALAAPRPARPAADPATA